MASLLRICTILNYIWWMNPSYQLTYIDHVLHNITYLSHYFGSMEISYYPIYILHNNKWYLLHVKKYNINWHLMQKRLSNWFRLSLSHLQHETASRSFYNFHVRSICCCMNFCLSIATRSTCLCFHVMIIDC